jgi:hypothetical protein
MRAKLNRDVLKSSVMMGKAALVRYNVSESEESGTVYWYEGADK